MSLKYTCIIVLSCFCFSLQAQHDYIITIQGDTLIGRVILINNAKLDRAQVITGSKKMGFTAPEVKEVFYNNDRFHAVQLGGSIKLMKLLKGGYLSLYGYRVENESAYSGRLMRKMDGTYVDLPILTFRGALTNFVKDCEVVANKVKTRELGRDDLPQVVAEYNQCINKVTDIKFKQSTEKLSNQNKRGKVLEFLRKIESSDLPNKADIADVLNDMMTRLESDKSIPAYQFEALKEYLQGHANFDQELATLLAAIQ